MHDYTHEEIIDSSLACTEATHELIKNNARGAPAVRLAIEETKKRIAASRELLERSAQVPGLAWRVSQST